MKKHDPIAAIRSEGQKAAQLPQRLGAFDVKPLNGWMDQAETMPEAVYLYHRVFVKGEVTALFAPTNAGKTIYSYQMADAVAHEGYRVLYIDCEMTLQSLRSRYFSEDGARHIFSENLIRAELCAELLTSDNPQEVIFRSIEKAAKEGFDIIFVDNISFLCADMEKGQTAGQLMAKICGLRKEYEVTILIVAHTPKRKGDEPLTSYSMFGSSMLAAFFDAIVAIGISVTHPDIRYVKTCKFRSGPYPYPADGVALYCIEQRGGFTQFVFQGIGDEADHLKPRFGEGFDSSTSDQQPNLEEIGEVLLLRETLSVRAVAEKMNLSPSAVQRREARAKKLGLTAAFFKHREQSVSGVSADSEATSSDTESDTQTEEKNLFDE